MPRIRNAEDFYAGVLFMGFGVAALVLSHSYAVGDASRMGPGYFPRVLGFLLLGFGALLSFTAFRSTDAAASRWRPRPLLIVLASVAAFALTAKWLGVVVATIALVFVASFASTEFKWKEALVSAALQGVFAVALFVYGLGIPLPVWPAFLLGAH